MSTITYSVPARRVWLPLLTVALGAVVFDLLFWDRELGLNLSLFVFMVVLFLVQRYTWKGLSVQARWSFIGTLVAGAMVYIHHSIIAMVASFLALGVSAALAHESRTRTLFFALLQAVVSFVLTPLNAMTRMDEVVPGHGVPRAGWRWFKLGVLPVLVLFVFTQLYREGNPKFDHLTAGFMEALFALVEDFFNSVFTAHTLFLMFAAVICGALLLRSVPDAVVRLEQGMSDVLVRMRVRRPHWMPASSMDPLERERRMGVILLVAVNLLLVVVNVIDIDWVWFGFEVPEGFSLKQFVHEGTWVLIISILLSMLIVMHLFRRNQNFYVRSKGLKLLAITWVVQNFILGVSVFLRNYHYISFHGLAYKRIGVMVFLALVLIGLITLYIKIRDRKSLFYLARVNGWAAFVALIGLTTVDWDSTIVRYNLKHWNQGEIDVDNYLLMSDKVLPLLYANLDIVESQMTHHRQNEVRWVDNLDIHSFKQALDAKRDRFHERYRRMHWQETNHADTRTERALASLGLSHQQQ